MDLPENCKFYPGHSPIMLLYHYLWGLDNQRIKSKVILHIGNLKNGSSHSYAYEVSSIEIGQFNF